MNLVATGKLAMMHHERLLFNQVKDLEDDQASKKPLRDYGCGNLQVFIYFEI